MAMVGEDAEDTEVDYLSAPEADWVREEIRESLTSAGIAIWGKKAEDAMVESFVRMLVSDRDTSARIVERAVERFGSELGDEEGLLRMAMVIRLRSEYERGSIVLHFVDENGNEVEGPGQDV